MNKKPYVLLKQERNGVNTLRVVVDEPCEDSKVLNITFETLLGEDAMGNESWKTLAGMEFDCSTGEIIRSNNLNRILKHFFATVMWLLGKEE